MDFEVALWQACSAVLPSVERKGCFFHWAQSIWRKVQEYGLGSEYHRNQSLHYTVRLLFGLPFAHAEEITNTFRLLQRCARTARLRKLFRYVFCTWIRGEMWQPRHWSVFGRRVRTNDVEGWHNRLHRKAFKSQPPFYYLAQLFRKESSMVVICDRFLQAGRYPVSQSRKRRYVRMNARIENYWSQHASGQLTSIGLVRRCAAVYSSAHTQ